MQRLPLLLLGDGGSRLPQSVTCYSIHLLPLLLLLIRPGPDARAGDGDLYNTHSTILHTSLFVLLSSFVLPVLA